MWPARATLRFPVGIHRPAALEAFVKVAGTGGCCAMAGTSGANASVAKKYRWPAACARSLPVLVISLSTSELTKNAIALWQVNSIVAVSSNRQRGRSFHGHVKPTGCVSRARFMLPAPYPFVDVKSTLPWLQSVNVSVSAPHELATMRVGSKFGIHRPPVGCVTAVMVAVLPA